MGNLAGWKHDAWVTGLHTWKNLPSMNDNAIAKLREAKLCTLFCLVPRAPMLHGTRECCMSIWLLHATHWSFSFCSLQKVSRQQILEACLKKFWMDFIFVLRLVLHIHALRKIRFGGSKAMDPRLFCHYFISSFFFKREIFFSKSIYCCSPNLYFF